MQNLLQESEPEERGDGDSVYALTFIALFILIIAWVNYINLATAKSFDRANEVGVGRPWVRRLPQLMKQFLAESFLVNSIASVIALVAVWAFVAVVRKVGWSRHPGIVHPYLRLLVVIYRAIHRRRLLVGILSCVGTIAIQAGSCSERKSNEDFARKCFA